MLKKVSICRNRLQYCTPTEVNGNTTWRQLPPRTYRPAPLAHIPIMPIFVHICIHTSISEFESYLFFFDNDIRDHPLDLKGEGAMVCCCLFFLFVCFFLGGGGCSVRIFDGKKNSISDMDRKKYSEST